MRRFFLSLLVFFLPFCLQSKEKICLVMIVKDESRVIKRCLDSVKPIIDYWVIVDTDQDGTQQIIKKHMKAIPGELLERPWRNFGENRSESIQLAQGKGDYFLFMDADDTLEFSKDFHPAFSHRRSICGVESRGSLISSRNLSGPACLGKWVGVTHEYLDCGLPYSSEILKDVKDTQRRWRSARSQGTQKFWTNISLLLDGLKKEPDNARYAFYLAESLPRCREGESAGMVSE